MNNAQLATRMRGEKKKKRGEKKIWKGKGGIIKYIVSLKLCAYLQ